MLNRLVIIFILFFFFLSFPVSAVVSVGCEYKIYHYWGTGNGSYLDEQNSNVFTYCDGSSDYSGLIDFYATHQRVWAKYACTETGWEELLYYADDNGFPKNYTGSGASYNSPPPVDHFEVLPECAGVPLCAAEYAAQVALCDNDPQKVIEVDPECIYACVSCVDMQSTILATCEPYGLKTYSCSDIDTDGDGNIDALSIIPPVCDTARCTDLQAVCEANCSTKGGVSSFSCLDVNSVPEIQKDCSCVDEQGEDDHFEQEIYNSINESNEILDASNIKVDETNSLLTTTNDFLFGLDSLLNESNSLTSETNTTLEGVETILSDTKDLFTNINGESLIEDIFDIDKENLDKTDGDYIDQGLSNEITDGVGTVMDSEGVEIQSTIGDSLNDIINANPMESNRSYFDSFTNSITGMIPDSAACVDLSFDLPNGRNISFGCEKSAFIKKIFGFLLALTTAQNLLQLAFCGTLPKGKGSC